MRTGYRIKSKMFGKDFFFLQKNTFISPSDYVSMYMSIKYGMSNRKAEILSLC